MRIAFIDTYYSAFLRHFYTRSHATESAAYDAQMHALLGAQFGTADFYSRHAQAMGHEARDFIVNNETGQKQWAREHHVSFFNGLFQNIPKLNRFFKPNWEYKILTEQLRAFAPDIIYTQDLTFLPLQQVLELKRLTRRLVGQIACPMPAPEVVRAYDCIVTSFPHYVTRFADMGVKSIYLKIAFEPSILQTLAPCERTLDAVFVGGFSKHHSSSIPLFTYLAQQVPIDFWGYGAKKLPEGSPIRARHHGEAWGHDMYEILHRAKISVNRHIDAAQTYANNMRLYESTGAGALLITDAKDNLSELFTIGTEIEVYHSKEDLAEKIQYYLSHDEERERIAQAGQARTLREHTYVQRMEDLLPALQALLAQSAA